MKESLPDRPKKKIEQETSGKNALVKEIRRAMIEGEKLVWVLVYDFLDVRNNSDKIRRFYRRLERFEDGERKTDSELVFESLADALLVRELASACGAKTRLYGGVEVSG